MSEIVLTRDYAWVSPIPLTPGAPILRCDGGTHCHCRWRHHEAPAQAQCPVPRHGLRTPCQQAERPGLGDIQQLHSLALQLPGAIWNCANHTAD